MPDVHDANFLPIAPHWPLEDGCITVPGYDIPILPASAIAQTAIYWSILQQLSVSPPSS